MRKRGKRRVVTENAREPLPRAYVRSFAWAPAKRQEIELLGYGIPAQAIYIEGRSAEGIDAVTKAARAGQLIAVAGGYRVFGENRRQIMTAVRGLRGKGAVIIDILTGERSDQVGDEMLDRAIRRLHGEATFGSPDRAAELGALGGTAKSLAMRAARMPIKLAKTHWFDKSISTAEAVRRMGPGWSKPTAMREFGPSGRPKGSFRGNR